MKKYWDFFALNTVDGKNHWSFNFQGSQIGIFANKKSQLVEKLQADEVADIANDFVYDKTSNSNSSDRLLRFLLAKNHKELHTTDSAKLAASAATSCKKGINFYSKLQCDEGYFPNDYGGPMFLLPGAVITAYVSKTTIHEPFKSLMIQYMLNHVNSDGGWGLHIEGTSTMFGTVLQYVSLRLLGLSKNHQTLERARAWIVSNGSATAIPSWGKFYLAVLGVYEWSGFNSVFPELWLLPKFLPFHPSRFWCHSRLVSLPMAYCYALKIQGEKTALVEEIRTEIYSEEYNKVDWTKAKDNCCEKDIFRKSGLLLKALNAITNSYEKIKVPSIRKKALNFILSYIHAEDEQTNYINLGPVNQMMNSICLWHQYGSDSTFFQKHVERWHDYMWIAEDGLKMQGYNGSHFWDVAFCMQAVLESGLESQFADLIKKGYQFIDNHQIKEDIDPRIRFFRQNQKGTWPFSTKFHGWPITDCTAEGIKTTLLIEESTVLGSAEKTIGLQRLHDPIDCLLAFQNKANGGWASYENTRAPEWIEQLNPSEIFGEIMIDYSYVECSSASIQALCKFLKKDSGYKKMAIENAIKQGTNFISSAQREDGSWYGSWAICFTYATWFGIEALVASRDFAFIDNDLSNAKINKACAFLIAKQNADGGWGESYQSCVDITYVQHPRSQIINTAWALLALMQADYQDKIVLKKGIDFIISRQEETGDWPQEGISGVFNKTCMITYTSYRNIFPIWALSRYNSKYQNNKKP